MGGPGGPGQAQVEEKARFRDHIHTLDSMRVRREGGDQLVTRVSIEGNRRVSTNTILQQIETRESRYYDYETLLADVRRLNDMGNFDRVTFRLDEQPKEVGVTFIVHERPVVTQVIFHGNRSINERELGPRAGVSAGDPLSEFAVESARRRLLDYYRDDGFNHASIETTIGLDDDPGAVVFRINEAEKERVKAVRIEGSKIVTEARLKKVIATRGPALGVIPYLNNVVDMDKIDRDVEVLSKYYRDLGYLTALVGRRIEYDDSGKWLTVTFTIDEGPRFKVNNVQVEGAQFVTEQSIRERLTLHAGDFYSGLLHRTDTSEIVYGYGEKGFIYADVQPQIVMRDEAATVDLVYKVAEGDRWVVGDIRVDIDGDPYLMRQTTVLNMVDLREGSWINLRQLEANQARLERSQLFEVNPAVADPPDIQVIPADGEDL